MSSSLAAENLAVMKAQLEPGTNWIAPTGKKHVINNTRGGFESTRYKLDLFLNSLVDKYIPKETIQLFFLTTDHFAERMVQRGATFNRPWVATLFTKLFVNQQAEFLFVLSLANPGDRVQLIMDGSTIAVEKVVNTRGEGYTIKVITIYVGTAQNKDHTYHTLNINTGD